MLIGYNYWTTYKNFNKSNYNITINIFALQYYIINENNTCLNNIIVFEKIKILKIKSKTDHKIHWIAKYHKAIRVCEKALPIRC